jgi:hypothetical protein
MARVVVALLLASAGAQLGGLLDYNIDALIADAETAFRDAEHELDAVAALEDKTRPALVIVASQRPGEASNREASECARHDVTAITNAVASAVGQAWSLVISAPRRFDGFCASLGLEARSTVQCGVASSTWPHSALEKRQSVAVLHTAFASIVEFEPNLATAFVSTILQWESMDSVSALLAVATHSRAAWGVKSGPHRSATITLKRACSEKLWDGSLNTFIGINTHAAMCIDGALPHLVVPQADGSSYDGLLAVVGPNATLPFDFVKQHAGARACADGPGSAAFRGLLAITRHPRSVLVRVDTTFAHSPPLYPTDSVDDVTSATAFALVSPCDAPATSRKAITWDFDQHGGGCITHRATGLKLNTPGAPEWPFATLVPWDEKSKDDAWRCRSPSKCSVAPGVTSAKGLEFDSDCSTMRFAMLGDRIVNLVRLNRCLAIQAEDGRLVSDLCAAQANEPKWSYDAGAGTFSTAPRADGTRWCLSHDARRARFIQLPTEPLHAIAATHEAHCADVVKHGSIAAATNAFVAALSEAAVPYLSRAGVLTLVVAPGDSRYGAFGSGARCLERNAAFSPLTYAQVAPLRATSAQVFANASTAVSPFICNRWVYAGSNGRILAVDWGNDDGDEGRPRGHLSMCLTRFRRGVRAAVCYSSSDERAAHQKWDWRSDGTLHVGEEDAEKAAGMCLTLPSICDSVVHFAGVMQPCVEHSRDQIWFALTRSTMTKDGGRLSSLVQQNTILPDCDALARRGSLHDAFAKVDRSRKAAAAAKAATGETESIFNEKYHLTDPGTGPFRSFGDVYDATPLGYLEWLYHSELRRGTSRFYNMRDVFTVVKRTATWSAATAPKHVFSWGLFLPRALHSSISTASVSSIVRDRRGDLAHVRGDSGIAPSTDLYGPLIEQDVGYGVKESTAPKSEAAARAAGDTLYDSKSFFQKYCQPMLDSIEHIRAELGPEWGVVVHLAASLHWLAPTLLKAKGNVEVAMMKSDGIRTAGSMWRWLPFDDTRFETVVAADADDDPSAGVLKSMWPAAEAFATQAPELKGNSLMRWFRGWKGGMVETNSHIGDATCTSCNNYATMQANFIGFRPRRGTYDWRKALVAASLHRVVRSVLRWVPVRPLRLTIVRPFAPSDPHPAVSFVCCRSSRLTTGRGQGRWHGGKRLMRHLATTHWVGGASFFATVSTSTTSRQ